MTDDNVPTYYENPDSLQAWAKDIEQEIAEITSSIIPLQQRLDAAHEKLDLERRLIHLTTPGSSITDSPPHQAPNIPGIEDHIENILLSQGKPMHIREIRTSLIQMGIPLPGRGDEANIILRLRRASNRFVRTERGTYALTQWNLPKYSPVPRKKKISKRRSAMS